MYGKIISYSFFLHAAISKPMYQLVFFLFCFEPGASVFPKVFYFRKMFMKIGCILDCFCVSLIIVSFQNQQRCLFTCKKRVLYTAYRFIKSIVVVIPQLFLAVLPVLLSFSKHHRVQLVLIVSHYLHNFSKEKCDTFCSAGDLSVNKASRKCRHFFFILSVISHPVWC